MAHASTTPSCDSLACQAGAAGVWMDCRRSGHRGSDLALPPFLRTSAASSAGHRWNMCWSGMWRLPSVCRATLSCDRTGRGAGRLRVHHRIHPPRRGAADEVRMGDDRRLRDSVLRANPLVHFKAHHRTTSIGNCRANPNGLNGSLTRPAVQAKSGPQFSGRMRPVLLKAYCRRELPPIFNIFGRA